MPRNRRKSKRAPHADEAPAYEDVDVATSQVSRPSAVIEETAAVPSPRSAPPSHLVAVESQGVQPVSDPEEPESPGVTCGREDEESEVRVSADAIHGDSGVDAEVAEVEVEVEATPLDDDRQSGAATPASNLGLSPIGAPEPDRGHENLTPTPRANVPSLETGDDHPVVSSDDSVSDDDDDDDEASHHRQHLPTTMGVAAAVVNDTPPSSATGTSPPSPIGPEHRSTRRHNAPASPTSPVRHQSEPESPAMMRNGAPRAVEHCTRGTTTHDVPSITASQAIEIVAASNAAGDPHSVVAVLLQALRDSEREKQFLEIALENATAVALDAEEAMQSMRLGLDRVKPDWQYVQRPKYTRTDILAQAVNENAYGVALGRSDASSFDVSAMSPSLLNKSSSFTFGTKAVMDTAMGSIRRETRGEKASRITTLLSREVSPGATVAETPPRLTKGSHSSPGLSTPPSAVKDKTLPTAMKKDNAPLLSLFDRQEPRPRQAARTRATFRPSAPKSKASSSIGDHNAASSTTQVAQSARGTSARFGAVSPTHMSIREKTDILCRSNTQVPAATVSAPRSVVATAASHHRAVGQRQRGFQMGSKEVSPKVSTATPPRDLQAIRHTTSSSPKPPLPSLSGKTAKTPSIPLSASHAAAQPLSGSHHHQKSPPAAETMLHRSPSSSGRAHLSSDTSPDHSGAFISDDSVSPEARPHHHRVAVSEHLRRPTQSSAAKRSGLCHTALSSSVTSPLAPPRAFERSWTQHPGSHDDGPHSHSELHSAGTSDVDPFASVASLPDPFCRTSTLPGLGPGPHGRQPRSSSCVSFEGTPSSVDLHRPAHGIVVGGRTLVTALQQENRALKGDLAAFDAALGKAEADSLRDGEAASRRFGAKCAALAEAEAKIHELELQLAAAKRAA